jgi:arsenate reductase
MSKVTLYHNPRCSKSRQTLGLLQERGVEAEIIEYLETPPDAAQLEDILQRLGMEPRQLLRSGEPEYRELGLDNTDLSRAQLVQAMVAHPKLIQRPIVLHGDRAALGRPPEQVLDII